MARELQFSISFAPKEDRLLMRGAFPDGTEVRLWLTRRITRGIQKLADEVSKRMVKGDVTSEDAKHKVAQFSRHEAVQQADYGQAFKKGEPHPKMGSQPLLVVSVSFTVLEGDRIGVVFDLEDGKRMSFAMEADHLWGLVHLVMRQAAAADWDLGVSGMVEAAVPEDVKVN